MRLRVARLSFGSVRAVELMLTLLVFLADRCQRMLGAPIILPGLQVSLLGLPSPGVGRCPDIGLRSSICVP